ncbi:hypothetical protein BDK51DRAFT_43202 [Blyttiomyces helicus]|uniref:Aminomethyltransferase folate-binding domain-containing protein n=1 Tax=Blyttiomyces helicus TaxID=388810 RepID=A0A4P9WNI4_9FUNG|nr:hypothetical protein BDK51DRAFT_43202 [Blyttiomyces helicus]|eukprot:RKO92326.1 hypothetical protein BDK51DRAFT_43202 [Blyttiomyces helicus]
MTPRMFRTAAMAGRIGRMQWGWRVVGAERGERRAELRRKVYGDRRKILPNPSPSLDNPNKDLNMNNPLRPPRLLSRFHHLLSPPKLLHRPLSTTAIPATSYLATINASNRLVAVPNRGIVRAEGRDAVKFLQGLVTNQMGRVENGGDPMLAAFLTPQVGRVGGGRRLLFNQLASDALHLQGRVLYDALIHPLAPTAFLLEVSAAAVAPLLVHLKKYVLRAKVSLADVSSEYTPWAAWGPGASVAGGGFAAGGVDPRGVGLGLRVLGVGDVKPAPFAAFNLATPEEYTLRRILNAVPEGMDDFHTGSSLPLESNLDFMSGGSLLDNGAEG